MQSATPILYLINYAGAGGTERYIMRLIEELPRCGSYRFLLVYNIDGPLVQWAGSQPHVEVLHLKMRHPFDMLAALRLRKIMLAKGVALVHTHFLRENFIAVLSSLGMGAQKPRLINTVHMHEPRQGLVAFFNRLFSRQLDKLVAVSKAVAGIVLQEGVSPAKVHVIYHGVEPGIPLQEKLRVQWRLEVRRELGVNENDLVFAALGRLSPEKGQGCLLEAFAQGFAGRRDVKLLLIGDGELKETLKTQIQGLNLQDNVLMIGYRQDVARCLAAADVFVLPSLSEALSFSLLEAMSAGLPCIGSRVGGIPEVLQEDFGVLVEPGDSHALAQAMVSMDQSRERIPIWGAKAREILEKRFSLKAMVQATHSMYQEIMRKRT